MPKKVKKVLAVGAHPDDIELGCAGTLSKLHNEGWEITCLIMIPPSTLDIARPKDVVYSEFFDSFEVLDIENYNIVNYTPLHTRYNLNNDCTTITEFEKIANWYSTEWDLVITHSDGDSHQDHVNTFNIVYSFCRKNVKELWCMESGLYFNRNRNFKPNVFVGIDDHFQKKMESLGCYSSYMNDERLSLVKSLAIMRGGMTTHKYAEAFQQMHRII